jgi:serine protease Do
VNRRTLWYALVLLIVAVGAVSAQNVAQVQQEMALALQSTFRRVAGRVLPVVVEVNVVEVVERRAPESPFDFFFGRPGQTREFRRPGLGSGVVVRRGGGTVYVLTNNHVVGDADEISLRFVDGREFDAELVGTDPRTDLALVSFETEEEIPIATLGDSDALQVGDFVIAVGNPLGFEGTVTSGIVSAVGRRPEPNTSISVFTDFIQTDASINPGNSGGGLANLNGEIVGINTWIASQGGGSVGLGFAIPINVAKRAIDDFIERGRVVYGWLGVLADDPAPQRFPGVADALGVDDANGVLVTNVYRGSPADRAGLQPGDFLISIGDEDVSDLIDLRRVVGQIPPGETRAFRLIRQGEIESVRVRIDELPTRADQAQPQSLYPGFYAFELTDRIRSRLRASQSLSGVVVSNVVEGSAADRAGFAGGDVITRVGARSISNVADLYEALSSAAGSLRVRVWRRGTTLLLDLRV